MFFFIYLSTPKPPLKTTILLFWKYTKSKIKPCNFDLFEQGYIWSKAIIVALNIMFYEKNSIYGRRTTLFHFQYRHDRLTENYILIAAKNCDLLSRKVSACSKANILHGLRSRHTYQPHDANH